MVVVTTHAHAQLDHLVIRLSLESTALWISTNVEATRVNIARHVSRVLAAAIHAHAGRVTATAEARPAATAKKTWTCVPQTRAKMAQTVSKTLMKLGPAGVPPATRRILPVQTPAQHANNVVWTLTNVKIFLAA
jgi:hypothetical protein